MTNFTTSAPKGQTTTGNPTPHVWAYGQGGWRPLEVDPLDSIDPGDGDFADLMQRAGYVGGHEGEPFACPNATVWEAWGIEGRDTDVSRKYPYIVDLNLNEHNCPTIYIEDLPSLLALMPAIGAITSWGILGGLHYTLDQFCRRGFRALHGHDLGDACPQCDPHTHKQWQEAARKRRRGEAK